MAQAQTGKEDPERAARRQKLLLQRAQADLEDAQAQRASLTSQKAAAETAARQSQGRAQTLARELAAARAQLAEQQQQIEQLQAQAEALREAQRQTSAEAGEREAKLRAELDTARQDIAQRLQTTQALIGLLQRSTEDLRKAESRNEALYREGLEAIERHRQEAGTRSVSLTDPLGLRAVRRDNEFDAMRQKLQSNAPATR